jgi:RHS repeat-associated protein
MYLGLGFRHGAPSRRHGQWWVTYNPVEPVQDWVNGEYVDNSTPSPAANEGFMLTSDNASNTIYLTNWQSSSTTQWPYLSVQYTPRIGTGAGMNSLKTQIDDKTTLGVNAANGDLNVDTSLFNIKGVGLPLQIDQNYDSQGATTTSMGRGSQGAAWALSSSFDQPQLIVKANYPGVLELVSSNGTNAVFTNGNIYGQFPDSPPGLNATAGATSSSTVAVTFNQSGEIWNFTQIAGSTTNYHLTNMADRNGNAVTYHYNTAGTQLTSITDTEGRSVSVGYNANSLVNSITDSTGRQINYGYVNPSPGVYRLQTATYGGSTTTYGYDTNGNLNEITDPIGNITTVAYNGAQQVTSVTRVTNNSTLAGNTTNYSYSPGSAASPNAGLTTVTDPNGHATTYAYDPWDRVTTVTDANGNHQAAAYNPQSSINQLTDSMTSPGITTLGYDANNNLNAVTSPATATGQTPASQQLGYSAPGHTYLPSSATDAQGNCTSYTYDTAGNVQSSTAGQSSSCTGTGGGTSTNAYQGDGSTTCGGKPGELCSVTDAKGHMTNYAYDSLGQLTTITPPSPQGATTLTYDGLSRPHTVATPTGTATYTYDVWDRITKVTYGSGPTLTYTYDADGNLLKRVDPSGTNSFVYDTLNRLTEQKLPASADSCSGFAGIKLYYDVANNLTSYCNGRGTTVYGYDPANRVTSLAEPGGTCTGTPSFCTTFGYNANNQRTTTTFPGGGTLNVIYDPAGNEMSAIGNKSTGGVLTGYTYKYSVGTNDTQLRQNVMESDPASSLTTNYTYDTQNRLSSAINTSTSLNYAYDAAGNRCSTATSCASPTYSYNAANQLTAGPAGSYGYDSSGEETSSPQLSNLSYNTAAQTTSITPSGGSAVSLSYADTGQFHLTNDGAATLNYGPLGLDSVTNGSTTTYLILDPQGNAIGQRTSGSGSGYFLKDATGSITAMISGTGMTTYDRFTYDPYGNKTVVSGSTYEFLGYAGGYQEANSALVKFGTRYYDSSTGRWTQVDPIGGSIANPSTINGYIYANDDPVNNVDLTGQLSTGSEVGIGIGVTVAAVGVSLFFLGAGPIGLLGALAVGDAPDIGATVAIGTGLAAIGSAIAGISDII